MSNEWVLSEIGDEYVAVPIGENADNFKGIIKLNETGRDIWNGLLEGRSLEDIAVKLVDDYDGVGIEAAYEYAEQMISRLKEEGLLIE